MKRRQDGWLLIRLRLPDFRRPKAAGENGATTRRHAYFLNSTPLDRRGETFCALRSDHLSKIPALELSTAGVHENLAVVIHQAYLCCLHDFVAVLPLPSTFVQLSLRVLSLRLLSFDHAVIRNIQVSLIRTQNNSMLTLPSHNGGLSLRLGGCSPGPWPAHDRRRQPQNVLFLYVDPTCVSLVVYVQEVFFVPRIFRYPPRDQRTLCVSFSLFWTDGRTLDIPALANSQQLE